MGGCREPFAAVVFVVELQPVQAVHNAARWMPSSRYRLTASTGCVSERPLLQPGIQQSATDAAVGADDHPVPVVAVVGIQAVILRVGSIGGFANRVTQNVLGNVKAQ